MILVFDTETSGFVHKDLPPEHAAQPHLVQLAALLIEEDGTERASVSVIVKPNGYTIPEAASNVHGITTDLAHRYGIPLAVAVSLFTNLRARSDELVAHNEEFDDLVLKAAISRVGAKPKHPGPMLRTCTMRAASPVVRIPPTAKMRAAGFMHHKPPSLTECVEFLFKEKLDGAHDAMVDCRACARVYFALREQGAIKVRTPGQIAADRMAIDAFIKEQSNVTP